MRATPAVMSAQDVMVAREQMKATAWMTRAVQAKSVVWRGADRRREDYALVCTLTVSQQFEITYLPSSFSDPLGRWRYKSRR